MTFRLDREPLARRRMLKMAAASLTVVAGSRPAGAVFRPLPQHKDTLAVAAIQASVHDAAASRENLAAMLTLLEKVQSYGGRKDICLFPAMILPVTATAELRQAARRHNCTLVFGARGRDRDGTPVNLMTTIASTGQIRLDARVDALAGDGVSVLVLRTPRGVYRAVACAAEMAHPEKVGLATAIYNPAGRAIAATFSRAEQAVSVVLSMDAADAS